MAILTLIVVMFGILRELKPTQAQDRMGCFRFTSTQPVLSVSTLTGDDSSTMTIAKCIDRCQLRDKTYAGIRFGYICWCGDNHHHTVNGPQLSDSKCTTTCSGDHRRLCGGQDSIVIFSVCNRGSYKNITNGEPNCDGRCHCLENSICPYFNGVCVAGCDPGWSAASCNVPACIYTSEDGCVLPCNCANNVACDETTGECRDGCRDGRPRPPGNETVFDWRGAGCKIGNVAYRKSASQSSTYRSWNAGNAVDGRLPPPSLTDWELQEEYCSHTDAPEASLAWWSVDLAGLHQIDNITLFNRYYSNGDRTSNVNITISNSSDFMDAAVCAFYLGPLPNGGNVTLSCESRLVGRYVRLQRTAGRDTGIINVCEVVVMGYEVVVEDVSKCLIPSDELASIIGCRECSGFEPPRCTIPCNAGSYGINCVSSCSDHHCNDSHLACDHVTGECPNGCENWYLGYKCIEHIKEPRLGNNVSVAAVSFSQIGVTWSVNDTIIANQSQYYGYQVQYKTKNDSEFEPGPNLTHAVGMNEYRAVIDGLHYNTLYTVRVNAYRQHGELYQLSIWPTAELKVKTSCIAPVPVNITSLTASTTTPPFSVDVEWQLGPSGCYNISSVNILYRLMGDWMTHDVINPTMSTNASLTVNSGGIWEVMIRVVNNENISSESKTETFTIQASMTTGMVTPTRTYATEQETPGSGSQVGVIAGAVAGGLFLIIIITIIVIIVGVWIRRRKTGDTGAKREDNMAASHRYVSADKPVVIVEPVNRPLKASKPEGTIALASATKNQGPSPLLPRTQPDLQVSTPQTPVVLELSSMKHSSSNPPTTEDPVTSVPISIVQLKTHINELLQPLPKEQVRKTKDGKKDITDGMGREFDDLPGPDFKTRTIGRSHANQIKNRFKNIQPFDDSRVKLEATDELSRSDYINASYITGYPKIDKHYIAAQGPTEDTALAFWFMIWQQRSNRIVMLTRINEGGKKKCAMYWPDDSDKETVKIYGPFKVSLMTSEVHADYAYRRLHLSYKNEMREVHQLHFLAWEDKKCPENNFPLLAFRGRVNKLTCDPSGPLVVHCSAGVGRTGTYITLDYLLSQAKHECQVDVFACVYRLRTQRMYMVQTEAQYAYLYNAVLEGIETRIGDIEIPVAQFIAQYDNMSREAIDSSQNALQDEYEMMCKYKPQATQGAASYVENIAKNRFQDILPDDRHRPRLSTTYSEGNDYINAVFVDSYQSRNATILTQTPLPNTVVDFWRLVYDYDCNTIVMLNGMDSSETCEDYFPEAVGNKETYGPIVVENRRVDQVQHPNMVVRTFRVSKDRKLIGDEPRTLQQFQFFGMENKDDILSQPNDLIALTEKVREWRRHQTMGTVVVHCIDGAERSGLFAAGSYMLDVLKTEHEVAVLHAARYITSRRPQAIQSMEHYQFLFDLAKCYLSGFHTYGNV